MTIGSGPVDGPCEAYTTWEEVEACGSTPTVDDTIQDLSIELATDVIWGLTGRRFTGACTKTVMPCWRGSCGCDPCGCSMVRRMDLGGSFPVWGVEDMVIDDVEVDNTDGAAFFVEDWRYLVYRGGVEWPRCRGDWSFTITYGTPIRPAVRRMTALLARQYSLQCVGDESCELNPQTSSYSREGVTVTLAAPADLIMQGFTGVRSVDGLLAAVGGRGAQAGLVDLSTYGRNRQSTWDLAEVDA